MVINFDTMKLLMLLTPFVVFVIYNRTKYLINAIKSKNKDSIKFELLLFIIVLVVGISLIKYSFSRI